MDILTRKELESLRERMKFLVVHPLSELQRVLAQHWLDKIKQRGVYIFRAK